MACDDLQEENRKLKRAVEELSIINDLSMSIMASRSSHEIISTIIKRSLQAVNAEQGVITIVDKQALDPARTFVRSVSGEEQQSEYHLNQALIGWMQKYKRPLLLNNPGEDERFRSVEFHEQIQSLICVPMVVKGELSGVLSVYNDHDEQKFSDEDQRLLAIIASQSAQILENARLYEQEQKYHEMQSEMKLATKIQNDLLPSGAPEIDGYDIAGFSMPARSVGGDYFDFIPTGDGRLGICLGDVTGKGLPAALLMANVQATLRGQMLSDASPRSHIVRANTLLFRSTDTDKFVTMFYAILDTETHRLSFVNAGHDNPYLFDKSNECQRLETGGTMLGLMELFPFEEDRVDLESGSVLVIYSDGISEAMNSEEEEYGEERLEVLIRELRELPSQLIIERIVASVKDHAGPCPQSDDITLIVLKRE